MKASKAKEIHVNKPFTEQVSFTDRPKTGIIFETCQGNEEPIIFTGHSRNLWVDFVANSNSSGRGFQISFMTIEGIIILHLHRQRCVERVDRTFDYKLYLTAYAETIF